MNTNYDNYTISELEHIAFNGDNLLAQAISNKLTAETIDKQLDYIEELEDTIASDLADQITESLKGAFSYYEDAESDHFEYIYYSDFELSETSFKAALESFDHEITQLDYDYCLEHSEELLELLQESKDTYLIPSISHNYWAPKNSLLCIPIGEQEEELEYHLKELYFPSEAIKRKAIAEVSEYYIEKSLTYAYADYSSDSINLLLTLDNLLEVIEEHKEARSL